MKKEEKTKQTKERILLAAMEEFGSKGYSGASLGTICGAGISKGLLYHNFESKDALYLACIERCFSELTHYLKKQAEGSTLQQYMKARQQFFQDHDPIARLFFEAILQPPFSLKGQILELQKEFNEFNCKLYQAMVSSLALRKGVTPLDAMEYYAFVQTTFNIYFESPAYQDMPFSQVMETHEEKLSKTLDLMLYGIAERRDAE